ncbi:MAG: sigma-54-dependent Fis family transcriptional regulator, partial [Deltaproteobacteria bacterium]|nr:sigma-54-dependent Fis family transcriptional regulator [Deltaproteobacteria bacterium]
FREDLYYRINVAEIRLPPLTERGDDILLLAQMFLEQHCARMGRSRLMLSPEVRQLLLNYPWPGNVRELNNEMERAAALTLGELVTVSDLSPRILATVSESEEHGIVSPVAVQTQCPEHVCASSEENEEMLTLQEMERRHVLNALQRVAGNRSQAAALLGITREGLRKKLLRIEKGDDVH